MCVPFPPRLLPSKQKYYNVRAEYSAAFYDVINWKGVSDLYAAALQVRGSVMVKSVLLRQLGRTHAAWADLDIQLQGSAADNRRAACGPLAMPLS